MSTQLEIRSFRAVFALERRIYRIDTLRLNPTGVPLRGIAYAAAAVVLALAAGALPPTDWLDPLVPWYLRDFAAPVLLATLLGALRIEGRPFHLAAFALLRHTVNSRRLEMLQPRALRARRWRPATLLCIADGSDARFRPLRYRGPGAVLVANPHLRAEWRWPRRAHLTLHPLSGERGRATVMELADGVVLEVRSK